VRGASPHRENTRAALRTHSPRIGESSFIGFGLFAYAVAKRLTGSVAQGATELASTVQPGRFAAGSAYFTGRHGEEKGAEAPESAELEQLEGEIAARKAERK